MSLNHDLGDLSGCGYCSPIELFTKTDFLSEDQVKNLIINLSKNEIEDLMNYGKG